MFARNVSMNLKSNIILAEFTKTMENEILPLLRKQKGFQDGIILPVPSGREIVAISFWDHKQSAEAYNSTAYPQVLKILAKLVDGTPKVRTFDVISSTTQKAAARVAA